MENHNCQYTDKDIWNYYSNLLSRDEEIEMQEHILLCNHCKQRLAHLRGITKSLDDEENVDMQTVQDTDDTPKKYPIRRYFFLAASAVALVIFLLQIIFPKTVEIPKDDEYPVHEFEIPFYSVDDTSAVLSDSVVFEIDTISIDQ